jgi:hypothetical protein
MRKIIYLFVSMSLIAAAGFGQIVIDQSDMPNTGDTLRVSVTNIVPDGFEETGMDTTWNFGLLEALSQRIDTFVSVTQTPFFYQLIFTPGLVANLASPRSGSFLPGVSVTDAFTFFNKTASSFSDVGSAYTIQGLPFPARYDNPEKLYAFPMSPSTTWASVSSFAINIPDLVYFSTQRTRSSVVDGWGSLVTPFGTFQTLRVKSEILEHDSVFIDSLGLGFPFNRNITEYKWLAKGMGIPVLTIAQEGSNVTATYRDIPRMSATPLSVTLGADTAVLMGTTISLYAKITGGTSPFQVVWNTLDTGQTLTITVVDTRTYTVIVVDALQNIASAQRIVSVKYPPGIGEPGKGKPAIFPNPSTGHFTIRYKGSGHSAAMKVFNTLGVAVINSVLDCQAGEHHIDMSGFSDGLYEVLIYDENTIFQEKIVIRK